MQLQIPNKFAGSYTLYLVVCLIVGHFSCDFCGVPTSVAGPSFSDLMFTRAFPFTDATIRTKYHTA
jgi:hypothetical protein